jgi:anti-sigma B factor antagonist
MQATQDDISGALRISGRMDIAAAGALRKALANSIQGQQQTVVDLSGVEACDAAGLQLLCAAKKTAAAAGVSFRLVDVSPAVLEASAALGLAPQEFGCCACGGSVEKGGEPGAV